MSAIEEARALLASLQAQQLSGCLSGLQPQGLMIMSTTANKLIDALRTYLGCFDDLSRQQAMQGRVK